MHLVTGYDTTSAITNNALTAHYVWTSWVDNCTAATTSSVSTSYIWPKWIRIAYGTHYVVLDPMDVQGVVDARSPEQRAADEARHEAMLADQLMRRAADRLAREAVAAKARALLEAMLTHQQREQLQRDQFFEVIAQHSNRRYRIRHGTHGNVRLLDDQGREVTRYCGQPPGVPTEDAMLAQMLQITHDEAGFLKAANATRVA